MKTERNILVAFLLNLAFSIFELIGGIFTNSVAIISDALHDFGDSISIGISYFLEKKSKKKPDNKSEDFSWLLLAGFNVYGHTQAFTAQRYRDANHL